MIALSRRDWVEPATRSRLVLFLCVPNRTGMLAAPMALHAVYNAATGAAVEAHDVIARRPLREGNRTMDVSGDELDGSHVRFRHQRTSPLHRRGLPCATSGLMHRSKPPSFEQLVGTGEH